MKLLTDFLTELIQRLLSKNPKFFKILQALSVIVGASAAVVLYLTNGGYELPHWIKYIGNFEVIINSIIVTIVAQLPKVDKV